jgi:ABC-2 type transport system permease protein
MMRHVSTLVRRELAAYFLSPMAYFILLAFQLIALIDFYELVEVLSIPRRSFSGMADPMTGYISASMPFWVAMLVAVPALTMRLVAEERRSGTIEGLLTVPVTETEVILAKWLAGVVMYLVLLLPFALYLPFLRHFGKYQFDLGPMWSLAIGLTTLGMMFVAIGLFFSTVTRNQIEAAVGTFAVLFGTLFVARFAYLYAITREAPWAEAARFSAVLHQVSEFGAGRLDPRFLAMHLSVAAFMLFASVKVLEARREK